MPESAKLHAYVSRDSGCLDAGGKDKKGGGYSVYRRFSLPGGQRDGRVSVNAA